MFILVGELNQPSCKAQCKRSAKPAKALQLGWFNSPTRLNTCTMVMNIRSYQGSAVAGNKVAPYGVFC
jgi:hypothetical protein